MLSLPIVTALLWLNVGAILVSVVRSWLRLIGSLIGSLLDTVVLDVREVRLGTAPVGMALVIRVEVTLRVTIVCMAVSVVVVPNRPHMFLSPMVARMVCLLTRKLVLRPLIWASAILVAVLCLLVLGVLAEIDAFVGLRRVWLPVDGSLPLVMSVVLLVMAARTLLLEGKN